MSSLKKKNQKATTTVAKVSKKQQQNVKKQVPIEDQDSMTDDDQEEEIEMDDDMIAFDSDEDDEDDYEPIDMDELEKYADELHSAITKGKGKKSYADLTPEERREKYIDERAKVHPDGGCVVISRLPYGFFEEQLKGFFSQFGVIRKIRLSRNPKTGKSRHYAFMEFDNKEVAAIVADTMDNYMMFGRIIKCKYISPENLHPDTFRNHHRTFRIIPWNSKNRQAHNAERTEDQIAKMQKRLKAKEEKARKRFTALGLDYDFAGFSNKQIEAAPVPKKKTNKRKANVVEEEKTVETEAPKKKAKKVAVVDNDKEDVVVAPKKKAALKKTAPVVEEVEVSIPKKKKVAAKKVVEVEEVPEVVVPKKKTVSKKVQKSDEVVIPTKVVKKKVTKKTA